MAALELWVKNPKRKGRRNEWRSMEVLAAAGYRCTRSAASLGDWDIVAIGTKDVVLCQVKSNEWPRTLERAALIEFQVPHNVRKIIHRWRDRQKLPDVQEL